MTTNNKNTTPKKQAIKKTPAKKQDVKKHNAKKAPAKKATAPKANRPAQKQTTKPKKAQAGLKVTASSSADAKKVFDAMQNKFTSEKTPKLVHAAKSTKRSWVSRLFKR